MAVNLVSSGALMDRPEGEAPETPELVYRCLLADFYPCSLLALCVVGGALLLMLRWYGSLGILVAFAFCFGVVMNWDSLRRIKVAGSEVEITNVWGFCLWRGPGAALAGVCLLGRYGLEATIRLRDAQGREFVLGDTVDRLEPLLARLKLAGVPGLEPPLAEPQWHRKPPVLTRVLGWVKTLILCISAAVICSVGLLIASCSLPTWGFVALVTVLGVLAIGLCALFVAAALSVRAERHQAVAAARAKEQDPGEG